MTLHSDQVRILEALKAAVNTLGMIDQLAIVGGLARHLAGDPKAPGDIDVVIEKPLCLRYWDFLEILVQKGLRSVRDVLVRPSFNWNPCITEIAHARALTINCDATFAGEKRGALDICFKADHIDCIPNSAEWVDILPDPTLTGPARILAIQEGRERLKKVLRDHECELLPPVMGGQYGLYYRLKK
jgi:hypothetical protein